MTSADETFLGFDFGTRRIGVAVANRRLGSARALATLACRGGPDWPRITQLVEEWRPQALVVGLPLTMQGQEQPATTGARRFMQQLQQRSGLPVHAADERMSSIDAHSMLRERRTRGQRRRRLQDADLDSTAAKLILEHWLSEHS